MLDVVEQRLALLEQESLSAGLTDPPAGVNGQQRPDWQRVTESLWIRMSFRSWGSWGTIAGFIFVMSLTRGVTNRLSGGGRRGRCNCGEDDHEELEHLRGQVADLEYSVRRIAELEERVDFAGAAPVGDQSTGTGGRFP